ncbi:anti-sigma factor [Gramella sp. AN32]|uniref:Anti-sigma factor domain-containing protein n=1 Tax=Christiangramia antarctica TaxID=2058158 RepID=A0ABW5X851_9FLAO|nr:anti-sigma factor [Gramella sp. AN32]MCM4156572.1 anti-sigma factor [Gramella sp. AN32]
MDINEYIESGILELYVYGALTEAESLEVSTALKKHPEILKEVEEIEYALRRLSSSIAPYNPEALLAAITAKLTAKNAKIRTLDTSTTKSRRTNWVAWIGWAACLLFIVGLFFMIGDNNNLREQLTKEKAKNAKFEQQIADARDDKENAEELLAVIRDKNVSKIPLGGQTVAPDAFATVYWNKKENRAYVDAKDLPEPPRGKVYQVWSLKLDPLTPTSIGLLADFVDDENKIFELSNANESEAFGITLEPEGGSKAPTMEQLYVLGQVTATP